MPVNLDQLTQITITGQFRGAYREPAFYLEGEEQPATLTELLQYLLDNANTGDTGELPEYFDTAAAIADGITSEELWKAANPNGMGLPPGTVLQLPNE